MSTRTTLEGGGSQIPGIRLRSDGSAPFVLWKNAETAASDPDNGISIFNGDDENFEQNGTIISTSGHGYLNVVRISSAAVGTDPVIRVFGSLSATNSKHLAALRNLGSTYGSIVFPDRLVVPLPELGAEAGTPTITLDNTALISTDYVISEPRRVYVAGCSQIAAAVSTAAVSASGDVAIVGWFSS